MAAARSVGDEVAGHLAENPDLSLADLDRIINGEAPKKKTKGTKKWRRYERSEIKKAMTAFVGMTPLKPRYARRGEAKVTAEAETGARSLPAFRFVGAVSKADKQVEAAMNDLTLGVQRVAKLAKAHFLEASRINEEHRGDEITLVIELRKWSRKADSIIVAIQTQLLKHNALRIPDDLREEVKQKLLQTNEDWIASLHRLQKQTEMTVATIENSWEDLKTDPMGPRIIAAVLRAELEAAAPKAAFAHIIL